LDQNLAYKIISLNKTASFAFPLLREDKAVKSITMSKILGTSNIISNNQNGDMNVNQLIYSRKLTSGNETLLYALPIIYNNNFMERSTAC